MDSNEKDTIYQNGNTFQGDKVIPVYIYLPDLPNVRFDVKVCLLPDSVFDKKKQKVKELQDYAKANDNL